jgi:hypothetical protein
VKESREASLARQSQRREQWNQLKQKLEEEEEDCEENSDESPCSWSEDATTVQTPRSTGQNLAAAALMAMQKQRMQRRATDGHYCDQSGATTPGARSMYSEPYHQQAAFTPYARSMYSHPTHVNYHSRRSPAVVMEQQRASQMHGDRPTSNYNSLDDQERVQSQSLGIPNPYQTPPVPLSPADGGFATPTLPFPCILNEPSAWRQPSLPIGSPGVFRQLQQQEHLQQLPTSIPSCDNDQQSDQQVRRDNPADKDTFSF